MPGYLLIEEKMLKPFRSKGFEPNPLRIGVLDYLRELRQEVFPFTREHRLRIVGLEEVLLAGESHLLEISLAMAMPGNRCPPVPPPATRALTPGCASV